MTAETMTDMPKCPLCDRPLRQGTVTFHCDTVRCDLRNAHFDSSLLNVALTLKAQLKCALALTDSSARHDNLRDVIGQALHDTIVDYDISPDGLLESDFLDHVAEQVIEKLS